MRFTDPVCWTKDYRVVFHWHTVYKTNIYVVWLLAYYCTSLYPFSTNFSFYRMLTIQFVRLYLRRFSFHASKKPSCCDLLGGWTGHAGQNNIVNSWISLHFSSNQSLPLFSWSFGPLASWAFWSSSSSSPWWSLVLCIVMQSTILHCTAKYCRCVVYVVLQTRWCVRSRRSFFEGSPVRRFIGFVWQLYIY